MLQSSFWRRHRVLAWLGGSAVVVLAVLVVAAAIIARRIEPFLRAQIVTALSQHLHARVELDTFHVSLGNGIHGRWGIIAEGRGLRIWPSQAAASGATDPLIRLDEFHFHAPLHYVAGKPLTLTRVQLSGLVIHIPPRPEHPSGTPSKPPVSGASTVLSHVSIERIDCDHAQLSLASNKPGKLPLGFDIQQLHLTHVSAGQPLEFEAQLINPRPVGFIHTTGKFGPWQVDDPGASPISGSYQFDHADLATFHAISGMLHSTGNFQGTLRALNASGVADVPDFALDKFSSPLPLHTVFQARIDGTNGDTWLDSVQASLGRSHFTTKGRIVRLRTVLANGGDAPVPPDVKAAFPTVGGHDIYLDIDIEHQRIDDFLRLTNSKQRPLLVGVVSLKAQLHIPPGDQKVVRRLTLDGAFQLDQAEFTSDKIQSKVNELSLRGQGHPGEAKDQTPQTANVDSAMRSHFSVAHATVTLPDLDYTVPGAHIQIKGSYGLEDGALDFTGNARMEATVSQMVGGWKGLLLKPADRFFKKDGAGALIPIHVNGTRDAPKFGLDFGRIKQSGTHPQRPDEAPAQPAEPQTN